MNKTLIPISKTEIDSLKKIFKMRGWKTNCAIETGISRVTINRALKTKTCSQETYDKLIAYLAYTLPKINRC